MPLLEGSRENGSEIRFVGAPKNRQIHFFAALVSARARSGSEPSLVGEAGTVSVTTGAGAAAATAGAGATAGWSSTSCSGLLVGFPSAGKKSHPPTS